MSNIKIPDDRYIARPTAWGYTKSKNGFDQFAIEFSIRFDDGGSVELTHFIGIQNEKGQEIMEKSCRTCGWTGNDFGAIELDVNADVQLKIENDDYGPKIKFIDPVDGGRGGGLIARQRMQASEQASLVAKLNARAKSRPASAPAPAARPTAAPANAAPGNARPATNQRPATNTRPAPAAAPKSDWFPGGEGDADGGDTIPF